MQYPWKVVGLGRRVLRFGEGAPRSAGTIEQPHVFQGEREIRKVIRLLGCALNGVFKSIDGAVELTAIGEDQSELVVQVDAGGVQIDGLAEDIGRLLPLTGLALMVFFVLAAQCMSTLAVVRRESGSWKWPIFMFGYMSALAYIGALVVYQGGQLLGFT